MALEYLKFSTEKVKKYGGRLGMDVGTSRSYIVKENHIGTDRHINIL